jgi:regulator of protease activity HflC (stomatin/prohibitin superfamily)
MSFLLFAVGVFILIGGIGLSVLNDGNKVIQIAFTTILGLALIIGSSCLYSQDVGEVVVLRNWGGQLAGYTETAGFHFKAPWQDTIDYDIRNNIINLYRNDKYSYDNGKASGAEVTVYDKSGAQANVDVQVIYSLDADAAIELYTKYQEQSNFVQIAAVNNVRDAARNASGQFSTIEMLTSRENYAKAIYDRLIADWSEIGLRVEEVNVQDVRYSQEIIDAYNAAQKTEISKVEAQNQQETEKVKMDTEVMKAEKEAEANRIRSESLTPQILQQEYIEALKNGKVVYVVPEGSMPVINSENPTT